MNFENRQRPKTALNSGVRQPDEIRRGGLTSVSIFDFVSEQIERLTTLEKLEARGTVRLALKAAGLDARTLTTPQAVTTLQKLMPAEMRARGVENGDQVCQTIVTRLEAAHPATRGVTPESPEAIFQRLARG
jgi:hypothetical protein